MSNMPAKISSTITFSNIFTFCFYNAFVFLSAISTNLSNIQKWWFDPKWRIKISFFYKTMRVSNIFISPLMSLTGFSLGMTIFHLEAFPLSALKSRFQVTNLHIIGLVRKILAVDGFYCIFDHGLGPWPAPDSRKVKVQK
jgi:hypothetical protein